MKNVYNGICSIYQNIHSLPLILQYLLIRIKIIHIQLLSGICVGFIEIIRFDVLEIKTVD